MEKNVQETGGNGKSHKHPIGDGVDSGFFDPKVVKRMSTNKAKLIEFSDKWKARPEAERMEYLIKLASSLNHAAQEIQKERDFLNKLLFSKEEQLTKLNKQLSADRVMIQKQLVAENAKQQKLLDENAALHKEIRELETKLKDASGATG